MVEQHRTSTPPDPLYAALGERVLHARRQALLSQAQLAERVGLTRTSITNVERGHQKIQVHTLYAIASALGVRPETLLPTPTSANVVNVDDHLALPLPSAERDWVTRVVCTREP
ncbi:MAG: helix-turn-helix domain-containing protein [Chloroflexota bacterium]